MSNEILSVTETIKFAHHVIDIQLCDVTNDVIVKMQVQFKPLVITDKVQEKKTSDFLTLYYHLSYITNDTY